MTDADITINSYVNCARLEDRPIDWSEIHDALLEDGHTNADAAKAISEYCVANAPQGRIETHAWALVSLLAERNHPSTFRYDQMLRDLEDGYVEPEAWVKIVMDLRILTSSQDIAATREP